MKDVRFEGWGRQFVANSRSLTPFTPTTLSGALAAGRIGSESTSG
jgi:hypothetical protein